MVHEGKRESHNINSLFWGTLILLVGATWLAINIGLIEPTAWGILLRMWPALLIIWGFNIIVSRTVLRFLAYLTPLILVAAFGYAAFYAPTDDEGGWLSVFPLPFSINHSGGTHVGELDEFVYVLDDMAGVEGVEVQLSLGAAQLDVVAADEGMASVEVKSNIGEPDVTLEVEAANCVCARPRILGTGGQSSQSHMIVPR